MAARFSSRRLYGRWDEGVLCCEVADPPVDVQLDSFPSCPAQMQVLEHHWDGDGIKARGGLNLGADGALLDEGGLPKGILCHLHF